MIPEELLYSLSNTHYVVGKKRSQQLAPLKDTKSEEQLKAVSIMQLALYFVWFFVVFILSFKLN